ncbi:uncharacterized protein LOC115629053 [Scaptodrosophila lebanonensis]|uniref:Uncharacterized protein LOC115629053 n=1 Tax=Drosophila lebanonensis TaxID=7225 RepID=A0A6J2U188_DROLE|nr:uncharacterized protein LOC115629053 [Scaptodrosophila lebanonensis]
MLTSTYQHDYVAPNARRYEFMIGSKGKGPRDAIGIVECQCVDETKIRTPEIKDCDKGVEWTGIAPMGRLVDPRLIPAEIPPDQAAKMAITPDSDCFALQPNRFLKILRTVYPDLYERLKIMPKEELGRRLETNRMYTTYQIDFCNLNEYPEGIYESLKTEDETSKINSSKLLTNKPPCAEFRSNVMQELERDTSAGFQVSIDDCEKKYKPFKTTFADSTQFVNSGDNSHWNVSSNTYRKSPQFTEYMDSISRNGCVIMRNRLHDHSRCLPNYCRHEIKFTCNDMKP